MKSKISKGKTVIEYKPKLGDLIQINGIVLLVDSIPTNGGFSGIIMYSYESDTIGEYINIDKYKDVEFFTGVIEISN